ncbi:hypothetical protein ABH968_005325 [Lysinibacillus sp. RC79]
MEYFSKDTREGDGMSETLIRIGTTYIPVSNVELSCEWYVSKLGAECSYVDTDKAILNFANQSIFLVRSMNNQSSNFIDCYGKEHFSITFEVDGLCALETIHKIFRIKELELEKLKIGGMREEILFFTI